MKVEELQKYFDLLPCSEREELQDEGLFVHEALTSGGYDSSPSGFVAFASTGGDGVHFCIPKNRALDGPVVMTVPMAFEHPNITLGKDMHEFLCLGCVYGFFRLEQLAYKFESVAQEIQVARSPSVALKNMASRFQLKPWSKVYERLCQLQVRS